MIRGLIFLTLFIGGLHVAYVFGSPMVKNTMLEKKMREIARSRAEKTESSVRRDVMDFVKDKEIDLDPSELVVVVKDKKTIIAAHYTTEASLFRYVREYEFFPASDESARRAWQRQGIEAVRSY